MNLRSACAVVAVAFWCGAAVAADERAKVDVELGTPMMLAGKPQTAYLRVGVTGLAPNDEKARAPLNVSIVLDQSGSMQGEKIESAKRAAMLAVERLRPNDVVSVITYQTTVNILVSATRIDGELGATSSTLNLIKAAIDGIRADGSTALFAGVSMGAGELRKHFNSGRVNRLVLLSDGLANVGPSSPGELGDLGASLAKEGVTVTTLGLGLDYNEDLMTRLASASDGNHMFIENVTDLERAYAMEFGDAMTVVARDAEVRIRCNDGVRPVRALGREAIIEGQTVSVRIGDVSSGRTKYCLLEVEVPAGAAGESKPVANVDVTYLVLTAAQMPNGQVITSANPNTRSSAVAVKYSNVPGEVENNTNKSVMVAAVQQIAADQNIMAMRLRDVGRIDEARKAYMDNGAFLQQNYDRYRDEKLLKDADTNRFGAENLDPEKWKYNRKLQQEHQVGTKKQGVYLEKGRK